MTSVSLNGWSAPENLIDATYGTGAGSFELGAFVDNGNNFMELASGSTAITGWTAGGGGVDWLTPPIFGPKQGNYSVDLTRASPGSLSTVIPTTPGSTYRLTFSASTGPTDLYTPNGFVSAGSLPSQPFSVPNSPLATPSWSNFTYLFTATGPSTTILFQADTWSFYLYGPAIDSVSVQEVTQASSSVIFTARPGVDIFEIWGSDGTEAGTQLIKNIRPGKRADIGPYKGFIKAGSRFLFAANDGINGRELWRTDGTPDGTYMLKDLNGQPLVEGYCTPGNAAYPMCSPMCGICPSGPECQLPYPMGCSIGSGSSNISDYDFVTTGTKAFFFVDNDNYGGSQDELWVSDGTAEGTQLVRSFASIGGQTMALAGNRIFFTANDDSGYGGELWVSDGTAGGTYMVKDINPGSDWSNSGPITGFGNKVVFAADDGVHGKEPWISDGTETGTYMINDLIPGTGSPDPRPFAAVGSKVAFMANAPGSGPELWVTDGTPDNATLIDIQPGSGGSIPGLFTTIDNKLWFTANDGVHGREPWIFDGNTATMLKDINLGTADGISPSSNPGFAKGHDSRVYFQAKGEIWTSDGTEAGTQMLKSIEAGLFAPAGSVTYFTAFDGQVTGSELWKTDGTEAGTVLVKDIWAGSGSSYPAMITAIEVAPDSDGDTDGIPDSEENGPTGNDPSYDGNSDGIPDSQQANVTSLHTADQQFYVTLSAPDGTTLTNVTVIAH